MALNKTELITAVAETANLSKVDAEKAVRATIDAISRELSTGGKITLIGFGSFEVTDRKERTGKNPRTGEPLTIPARRVARFRPGKMLADMVMNKPDSKKGKAEKTNGKPAAKAAKAAAPAAKAKKAAPAKAKK